MSKTKALWRARKRGDVCARCARRLQAAEPVWRRCIVVGWSGVGWRRGIAPVCGQCSTGSSKYDVIEYLEASPCEGCRRSVYNVFDGRGHRRVFCCKDCESKVRSAEARDKRLLARGATRACEQCGETFEPTRADARYCSITCKQAAYRHRVMDIKSGEFSTFDIRNAATARAS
jgi:hypothetical protein